MSPPKASPSKTLGWEQPAGDSGASASGPETDHGLLDELLIPRVTGASAGERAATRWRSSAESGRGRLPTDFASSSALGHSAFVPPASEFHWHSAGPSAVHAHVTQPIVRRLDAAQAQRVLDIGCGNGWFAAGLVRCGFDAVGVDVSESGIEVARNNHPEVDYRRLDLMQVLPDDLRGQFDAVVAIDLLDHVLLPREVLRQALHALRPGGLLIVTIPYHGYLKNLGIALSARLEERLDPLKEHGRIRFFSRRTILALLLQCGLSNLELQMLGRVPVIARSMLVVGTAPSLSANSGLSGDA